MPAVPTFEIAARIDHLSAGVGCFDPMQVVNRMRVAFPELIVENRDHLQEACEFFRGKGAEGALRIAVRDIQERGPAILFQIPLSDGRSIRGWAERYSVRVTFAENFPDDFRDRFTDFLRRLFLQPIQITTERDE